MSFVSLRQPTVQGLEPPTPGRYRHVRDRIMDDLETGQSAQLATSDNTLFCH